MAGRGLHRASSFHLISRVASCGREPSEFPVFRSKIANPNEDSSVRRIDASRPRSSGTDDTTEAGKRVSERELQFCSVGRIGPSPLPLQGNPLRIGSFPAGKFLAACRWTLLLERCPRLGWHGPLALSNMSSVASHHNNLTLESADVSDGNSNDISCGEGECVRWDHSGAGE